METARGVRGTTPVERAPANIPGNTLLDVVPFEQFAIRYVDGEGTIRTTIVVKFNGDFYVPANGEEWSKSIKPANEWLSKILKARDASKGAVPKSDDVDVMGGSSG